MWYASARLRCRVLDPKGALVGTLVDLLAPSPPNTRLARDAKTLAEQALSGGPLLRGLLVETAERQLLRVLPAEAAWEAGPPVQLRVLRAALSPADWHPDEVRLAATVLNHEAIDLEQRRVVVVNDLAVDETWHLLGLDGSPFGLLHWLLPQRLWQRIAQRFEGTLLPWEQVVLLPADAPPGPLPLARPAASPLPLAHLHPSELAELVRQLSVQEGRRLLTSLDAATAAATLAAIAPADQARLLAQGDMWQALALLEALAPDEAADVLAVLPAEQAEALLERMMPDQARAACSLLAYPADSAGGLMTTDYLLLDQDYPVAEALERVRHALHKGQWITDLYGVAGGTAAEEPPSVLFAVSVFDLLAARPEQALRDLARRPLISIPPEADVPTVAERMSAYHALTLPVIDRKGRLLGVIPVDAVLDRLLGGRARRRLRRMAL